MSNRIVSTILRLAIAASLLLSSFAIAAQPTQASIGTDQAVSLLQHSKEPFASKVILASETDQDAYFLTKIDGKEPATDSASAATAISTGYKTDAGNLAWLPGDPVGGELTTIAETLRADYGFAIGVGSTVQFSHATPAGFVSHNVYRSNYAEIAQEIIYTTEPEVVIGGGNPEFNGGEYKYVGGQATWNNLLGGLTAYDHVVVRQPGVDGGDALLTEAASVDLSADGKLIAIFGGAGNNFDYHVPSDMPGAPSITQGSVENPTFADVVTATLSVLNQDADGLFVVFEQGDIDWSNHANDFASMVGGVWDLDQAVRTAEEFIDKDADTDWTNTLLIVTSDHSNSFMRLPYPLGLGDLPQQVEGGGAGLYGGDWLYPDGEVTYRTYNHTNELVTLWARGQSAYLFETLAGSWYSGTQIIDNSQIYAVMLEAVEAAGVENVILFIGDGMNIEHEIAGSRYLYGSDYALAWHDWGQLPNGWAGYASTWDVTTYDKYAVGLGANPYVSPVDPVSLGTNDAAVGYDPDKGGAVPYPIGPGDTASMDGREAYFLTKLGGSVPATDSASAATALSTGYKTDRGNIAWLPGDPITGSLTTIAETLRSDLGFAIGVGSTVQFSHASPASFVSHNVNRGNYAEIANEIIFNVAPEVVIGGGNPDFNGGEYKYVGGMTTWNDLNAGTIVSYTHVVTREVGVDGGTALLTRAATVNLVAGDKLIGIFGGAGNNFEYHEPVDNPGSPSVIRGSTENPTLADIANASLSILDQDTDGFFVMFEQGDIDWSNHANHFAHMVGGIWDLDQAVQAAEAFVDQAGGPEWSDSLIIVTADHSNSYMRNHTWLGSGDLPLQVGSTYPDGEVTYQTTGHTNELVTLWARGQGAELFSEYANAWYVGDNIVDNTQIYEVMLHAAQEQGVEHIILFVGDGMNIEHEIAGSRYLYGIDQGLAWHSWRNLANGWGGFASTWDVTTYNRYATDQGLPAYNPASFDPLVGYDPLQGGSAPFRAQAAFADLVAAPTFLYVELDSNATLTETLTITKTGSGNATWNLVEAPAADWISASPTSGVLAYDGSVDISVVFDSTGLAAGFYETNLRIQTPYEDLIIPVVLKLNSEGTAPQAANQLQLDLMGSYQTGVEGAAEIVAYDPENAHLFVTNGANGMIDVLSIADLTTVQTPTLVTSIDLSAYGDGVTSVAFNDGLLAAALPADPHTDNGVVVLIAGDETYSQTEIISLDVGALPDMVTFTPDGSMVLVANEGEPNDDYSIDPEGSVSVIDVTGGISATTQADVTNLDFTAFNGTAIDPQIRIFGPNATVAQDLEPEYIAVSADTTMAWVTLQENNALAVVDLVAMEISELTALGFKDWSSELGLDASDRDDLVNITNWQVYGMYQPDGIASYEVAGTTYLVTANEGDARDYDGYSEEDRIGDVTLDPEIFPHASVLQMDENLGRLKLSVAENSLDPSFTVDPDQDGDVDQLYVYGARSFSIWNGDTGALVYDSGDDIERITAAQTPDLFNANDGDPAEWDKRSDDKGAEPESVVVAEFKGRVYAFVALERSAGGVMIYDVTNPAAPAFEQYLPAALDDISPEGLKFIPADQSPTGNALLVIANEVSGSTTVYEITVILAHDIFLPMVAR